MGACIESGKNNFLARLLPAGAKIFKMRKLFFTMAFLLTVAIGHAQHQVYNVQWYCVDEKPFKKGQCDISGNEYSFVFVDNPKKQVTFFFTSMKLKYNITESYQDATDANYHYYVLENEKGRTDMRINKAGNKIEFIEPDKIIYLTAGKTTKLERGTKKNVPE
jgi:hypothetical protein